MGGNAPNWAEQWGSGGDAYEKPKTGKAKLGGGGGGSKKIVVMKEAATKGLGKAKTVAVVGAKKVKIGSTIGIKWVKKQYQKRCSSK